MKKKGARKRPAPAPPTGKATAGPARSALLDRGRLLFAATLFVSAALAFSLQPLVGRALLPVFGGAAAVWSTCLAFFQVILLAGYLYGHMLRRLGLRTQVIVHVVLALAVLALVPVRVQGASAAGSPTLALLGALARVAGGPYFVVTTTAPLLQRWLSRTRLPGATDPYSLYVASNLGSVVGLLGYPLVVEPRLRLGEQSTAWAWGYGLFVLMTAAAGLSALRAEEPAAPEAPREPSAAWAERGRWALAALVPSSLTVGATATISARLAAIPLAWVVPLGLYLGSFVVAFSRRGPRATGYATRALPFLVVATFAVVTTEARFPLWLGLGVVTASLVAAGVALHGRLAVERPPPARLTEYWLWVAIGGAAGGAITALGAPLVLRTVSEYPAALAAAVAVATLLAPKSVDAPALDARRTLLACAAALALGLVFFASPAGAVFAKPAAWLEAARGESRGAMRSLVALVALSAVILATARRGARVGISGGATLAAFLFAVTVGEGVDPSVIARARSFYGVLSVTREGSRHVLMHGSVLHGSQDLAPDQRGTPRAYYQPGSPIGRVFEDLEQRAERPPVLVIGLGVGSLAAYHAEGQSFTFYEIDPEVARIARDPNLFGYLADAEKDGARVRVEVGDGRMLLASAPDGGAGVLVVDAFSGASVPVHLLTLEAMRLYARKIGVDGVIALHLSNGYLDLSKVAAAAARDAELEAMRLVLADATWVLVARTRGRLTRVLHPDDAAKVYDRVEGIRTWTDDYADVLSVVDWSGDGD